MGRFESPAVSAVRPLLERDWQWHRAPPTHGTTRVPLLSDPRDVGGKNVCCFMFLRHTGLKSFSEIPHGISNENKGCCLLMPKVWKSAEDLWHCNSSSGVTESLLTTPEVQTVVPAAPRWLERPTPCSWLCATNTIPSQGGIPVMPVMRQSKDLGNPGSWLHHAHQGTASQKSLLAQKCSLLK